MSKKFTQARSQHLQKVIELCMRCLENVAYYRSGWNGSQQLFKGNPYRLFNANCFDHVYLEWYKLFGSTNDHHHWRNVVKDSDNFKIRIVEDNGV